MAPEKIDKIFKDKFEHLSEFPEKIEWKKEDAWKRFKNKTKRTYLKQVLMYSSAAVFIIAIFISVPKINEIKNQDTRNTFQNDFEEYRKRQKLKEIEMRISGKKIYENYCMNCEGLIPEKGSHQINIFLFTD